MGSDAHIPSTSRNSKGFSLIKETALLLGKFFPTPYTLHPTPYTLPTFQVACHPVSMEAPVKVVAVKRPSLNHVTKKELNHAEHHA